MLRHHTCLPPRTLAAVTRRRPETGGNSWGLFVPGCGRLPNRPRTRPEAGGSGSPSARAGPAPGTAGDPRHGSRLPGSRGPRPPPTSLQQPINIPWVRAGGNGLSSAPSGPGPSPPRANCGGEALDSSQRVSAWQAQDACAVPDRVNATAPELPAPRCPSAGPWQRRQTDP